MTINPTEAATAFEKIVETIRKNFLWIFLTVVLGLMGFGGYTALSNFETLKEYIRPSVEIEAERFYKANENDVLINRGIEVTRSRGNFDRVIVFEFHNNQQGLAGFHWAKATARYFSINRGVSFEPKRAAELPTTMFAEILIDILPRAGDTNCIVRNIDDIQNSVLRYYIEDDGSKKIFVCGVRSHDGTPRNMVIGVYMHPELIKLPDDKLLEIIRQGANDAFKLEETDNDRTKIPNDPQ